MQNAGVGLVLVFLATLHLDNCCGQAKNQESESPFAKGSEIEFVLYHLRNLASSQSLAKEFGLVDKQLSDIRELADDYSRQHQKQLMGAQAKIMEAQERNDIKSEASLVEEHKAFLKKLRNETMEKVKEVLLPHQMERLFQIALQKELILKSATRDEFGMIKSLVAQSDLGKTEQRKVFEEIDELREEFLRETKELQTKTRKKLIDLLPSDLEKSVESKLGGFYGNLK